LKKNKNKKKILIIKFGAIGDIVHSSVIATSIKRSYPDCEVHFLTTQHFKNFVSLLTHVDKVQVWDTTLKKSKKYFFKRVYELSKERYDIVFNLTRSLRHYLISYLMFPKRVANKMKVKGVSWVEEYFLNAKRFFKDVKLPERLYMNADRDSVLKVQDDMKQYPRPFVVISPGGEGDNNRQGRTWGLNNWNALIELLKPFGGTVFVIGASSEKEKHSSLSGAEIFSGKYSLSESSAMLSEADLVISGDSGPAHISAAYGVKTLVLLGSTSVDKIKPFGYNGWAVSSPNQCNSCWKKKCKFFDKGHSGVTPCMDAISPDLVIQTIKENNLL